MVNPSELENVGADRRRLIDPTYMSDSPLKLNSDRLSEKDSDIRDLAYEKGIGKGSDEYCGFCCTFTILRMKLIKEGNVASYRVNDRRRVFSVVDELSSIWLDV